MQVAILMSCAALLGAAGEEDSGLSGMEKLARTPTVSLRGLQENAPDHLGLRVRLQLILGTEQDPTNPYFTRFTSAAYQRFQCWDLNAPLWESEQFENVFGHLFVPKTAPLLEEFRKSRPFEQVEVTAIVRDTFRGIPWLEAVSLKKTGNWIPEGTLITVTRAHDLRKKGQNHLAVEALKKALVEPLPSEWKRTLLEEMAQIWIEKQEWRKAADCLRDVQKLYPKDEDLARKLKWAEQKAS